jgi:integrase
MGPSRDLPLRPVKPYGVDNVRLQVCSPAEIQTLLAKAPADLTVVQSKSGKARRVPLTPELRADLLARCHATSGFVFGLGKAGHPPTAAAVSVAFARWPRR